LVFFQAFTIINEITEKINKTHKKTTTITNTQEGRKKLKQTIFKPSPAIRECLFLFLVKVWIEDEDDGWIMLER